MPVEQLIPAEEICSLYQVEISFIQSLDQLGLIQLTIIKETGFIDISQLEIIEKFARLHYDLDINAEGIDAINHLLDKVKQMHREISVLKSRLRLYETV